MTVLVWIVVVIGIIVCATELGIMVNALVNYIKDKMWEKQVIKEMLKKYNKI